MTIEILASHLGGILARIQDASVLAENQQNLRLFFDTIGDLVFIVHESGHIIEANRTALTRLGYSPGDLVGKPLSVIYPATTRDEGNRLFTELASGKTRVSPLPLMSSSGEFIPAEVRSTRGTWSGDPALFVLFRDISVQEQMGRELRDMLDLNEKIIASSLLGIIAYRADSERCVMTNQAATTILGIPAEQILFRRFRDIPCWHNTPVLSLAEKVLKTGEKQRLEIRSLSPEGSPLWLDCILIPFTSNAHLHLLCIFDDISNRKFFEDEARNRELILRSIARSARSLLGETGLDDAIRSSLQDLGQAVGVDRVYIFENHRDPGTGTLLTSQRYEWTSDGIEQMILSEALQHTPYSLIPRWEHELSSGRIISGLVEEFERPVRELLADQGIISILIVPILTGNEFWGFIGFDDCHTRRVWTPTDNIVLKAAADIIGGAICRRKMVDALFETKQQLADIIEHLPDATMVISSDGIVTAWNRAMEDLTGVMGEDMIGQGDHRYAIPFYGDRRPILADQALHPDTQQAGSTEQSFIDKILSGETIVTRDGQPRHLSARASVLRDTHDRVIGAVESIRDITWQVEAEQKIHQYTLDLEDKNRDLDLLSRSLIELNQELDQRVVDRTAEVLRLLEIKNDLITQIGHDLKTPLTPIIALLPEVLDQATDPVMREYLTLIHRNAERLRQVVMMVLAYSRLEAASAVMNPSGVQLRDVFDQACLDSGVDIKQKRLTVHNSIPLNMRLMVAETHAQTLAMNLISNAVKYSLPGGYITIKALRDGEQVKICISDTGIGLTSEERSRVFEEFYQADTSRHDRSSCGLGLAIVSRIVTMYGGTITAYSDGKGKGSEFCICLDSGRIVSDDRLS
jgi:PAS domain S-box-containing protein